MTHLSTGFRILTGADSSAFRRFEDLDAVLQFRPRFEGGMQDLSVEGCSHFLQPGHARQLPVRAKMDVMALWLTHPPAR